jgi:hypothetical protein
VKFDDAFGRSKRLELEWKRVLEKDLELGIWGIYQN